MIGAAERGLARSLLHNEHPELPDSRHRQSYDPQGFGCHSFARDPLTASCRNRPVIFC